LNTVLGVQNVAQLKISWLDKKACRCRKFEDGRLKVEEMFGQAWASSTSVPEKRRPTLPVRARLCFDALTPSTRFHFPPPCRRHTINVPTHHDHTAETRTESTPAAYSPTAIMGSRLESNSDSVRKRIAGHTFDDEEGDEYGGSAFGGFTDYFRRKKIKLQNRDADLRSQAGEKPPLFKGVVAHVNGYTQPSLNDLHTLIVQHGGGFLQYLDGKTFVTHIIASSLTPKKAVDFRRYRIVKPAWVVESIAAGKLLPWSDYRVVDEGEKQNVLAFDRGKVLSQANVKKRGYRDQTDASWYTSQLLSSQTGPASTPTPSSAMRSRFSKQRLPTPEDDIDDVDALPPSHQPESDPLEDEPEAPQDHEKLVTPPKTSPTLAPQKPRVHVPHRDTVEDEDDLYADPIPPCALQVPRPDVNGERVMEMFSGMGEERPPDSRQLTAEEHNAILLRDPKIRKSTVVDPNFLEQYYRESRLHHLSTWKADEKAAARGTAIYPAC
jgi:DNA repair protein REV1